MNLTSSGMVKVVALAVLFGALTALARAQDAHALVGPWHGSIEIPPNISLRMQVDFKQSESGLGAEIRVPEQTDAALPLDNVRAEGENIHMEFAAGIGRATYDGTLKDGVISGTFLQNGMRGTFRLERGALPQPEVKPLPGRHEEVRIKAGEIELAGTFSVPESTGPFAAVLCITGSGAQNRDEEVAGFAFFRELARFLLGEGVAVLRCDDRGIGASTGSALTVTTHTNTDDMEAAFRWLLARKEVDPLRAGLVGHSEGGVIAPLLAGRISSTGFLVLLAPSCVKGDELLFRQGELLLKAGGGTKAMAVAKKKMQAALFHWMRTGDGRAEVDALVGEEALAARKNMPESLRGATEEEFVVQYLKRALAQCDSPWMRAFIDHDPAPALRAVQCPTLALFGARDLQVPPSQNRPALEAAFVGKEALLRVVTVPKANHLFQSALTGGVHEYTSLKKEFAPGVFDELGAFLRARTAPQGK